MGASRDVLIDRLSAVSSSVLRTRNASSPCTELAELVSKLPSRSRMTSYNYNKTSTIRVLMAAMTAAGMPKRRFKFFEPGHPRADLSLCCQCRRTGSCTGLHAIQLLRLNLSCPLPRLPSSSSSSSAASSSLQVQQQGALHACKHAGDAARPTDRQGWQHRGVRQHPPPRLDALESGHRILVQAHLRKLVAPQVTLATATTAPSKMCRSTAVLRQGRHSVCS